MPLFDSAAASIRLNLEQIRNGQKARLVAIGTLTDAQLAAINARRTVDGFPSITSEVVFIGKHIYISRIVNDGYTVEDVIEQIASAMQSEAAVLDTEKMTAMENPTARADRYGNQVRDRVVFECTARYPRPELLSVIPKGDQNKPRQ
jgi:hypothetical protein